MDYFLAIMLYFQGLTGLGFLPLDHPLAPPGPEYNPPAQVQQVEINGLRVPQCGPQW